MATASEAIEIALRLQQAGRFEEAAGICREVLAVDRDHVGALRLLGEMACQLGDYARAAECYERAIQRSPDLIDAHCNLGTALQELGRLDEAAAWLRRAIELKPDFAEAHFNLGNVVRRQGRSDEAVASYRRALAVKPGLVEVHANLALIFAEQGDLNEAAECYRRALELQQDLAVAHNGLGTILQRQSQLEKAVVHYRRAVELHPGFFEAWNNLGLALTIQGNFDEAEACLKRAMELNPNSAAAHNNLGNVYRERCQPNEAIAYYRRALTLAPGYSEAHHGMGVAFDETGEHAAAADSYERALALKPDFAAAHLSRATNRLLRGDFQSGWPEYEWRWRCGQIPERRFSQPEWDGRQRDGQTILLYAEQGFGDTLQFVRYAPLVKQRAGTVLLECSQALFPILRSCPGIDALIEAGTALPPFDAHAALLSLPRMLDTRLESIPDNVPYLFASASLVQAWGERLDAIRGFRIGINWRGRGGRGSHRLRDIPLESFREAAELPEVRLVSLQNDRENLAAETKDLPIFVPGDDVDTVLGAFMDTAAIIRNLDLVITSDTAVAHLAGALGVPVWTLLPVNADWRWLLVRDDSPWYPTMRLFRQNSLGNWKGVFGEVVKALQELVNRPQDREMAKE